MHGAEAQEGERGGAHYGRRYRQRCKHYYRRHYIRQNIAEHKREIALVVGRAGLHEGHVLEGLSLGSDGSCIGCPADYGYGYYYIVQSLAQHGDDRHGHYYGRHGPGEISDEGEDPVEISAVVAGEEPYAYSQKDFYGSGEYRNPQGNSASVDYPAEHVPAEVVRAEGMRLAGRGKFLRDEGVVVIVGCYLLREDRYKHDKEDHDAPYGKISICTEVVDEFLHYSSPPSETRILGSRIAVTMSQIRFEITVSMASTNTQA